MGEHESRTSRIRRSRKRPLGEAASSPASMLDREKRQRVCGWAGAATRIFSSASGQKIRAQQHRPLGGSPKSRERRREPQSSSLTSLFSFFQPSLSDGFFFPPSTPRGEASRSGGLRWRYLRRKAVERSTSLPPLAFSRQSEDLIRNSNRWRSAHPWPSLAAHDARRLPGASPTFQRTPPIAHVLAYGESCKVQHLSLLSRKRAKCRSSLDYGGLLRSESTLRSRK